MDFSRVMCPTFICVILQVKLMKSQLLASLFDRNCNSNSHTDHRVVTRADQTHHFFAVDAGGELQSGETF